MRARARSAGPPPRSGLSLLRLLRRGLLLGLLPVLALGPRSRPAASEEPPAAPAAPRVHALLVGVSEYPLLRERLGAEVYEARVRLHGPENDVALWRDLLVGALGVAPERVVTLAGWRADAPLANPTRDNILRALRRLARTVAPGDLALVAFAGHGTRVPDVSGDEADGFDEVLLPADVRAWDAQAGQLPGGLLDDDLGPALDAVRAAGARVWAVLDCCHAGTLLRGGEVAGRTRRLSATVLGVPAGPVARGGPARREGALEGARQAAGLAATYAAPADERTSEALQPRGAPDARWHGLLTFALVEELRRTRGALALQRLDARLERALTASGAAGARPYTEGDLGLTLFGPAPADEEPAPFPLPAPRLALALVDAEGRALHGPRAAAPPPDDVRALVQALARDARFPLVERPEEADWLVVRSGPERFGLRPVLGGEGPDRSEREPLPERLALLARAQGLVRLAASAPGRADGARLALHAGDGRELADGAVLVPGERLRLTLSNPGPAPLDVWLLLLDAAAEVSVLFPGPDQTPRLAAGAAAPVLEARVSDRTLGVEHVLAIAVPADPQAPPLDLRWLAAPPARLGRERARAPGGAGRLADLLAAYAGPAGAGARAPAAGATGEAAFTRRTYRAAWGGGLAPFAPPIGAAGPVDGPDGAPLDLRSDPAAWAARVPLQPAADGRTARGARGGARLVALDPRGGLGAGGVAPVLLVEVGGERAAALDTDLDGRYDLLRLDLDGDGYAEQRASGARGRTGDGAGPEPVREPWVRLSDVRWPSDDLLEAAEDLLAGVLTPPR